VLKLSRRVMMLAIAAASRPGTYGRTRSTTDLVLTVDPGRVHSYVRKCPLTSEYGVDRHPARSRSLHHLEFPPLIARRFDTEQHALWRPTSTKFSRPM
jgi:hypothetical protein